MENKNIIYLVKLLIKQTNNFKKIKRAVKISEKSTQTNKQNSKLCTKIITIITSVNKTKI